MIATTFRIRAYSHSGDFAILERSLNLYEIPQVNEIVHLWQRESCVLGREFVIESNGMTCEVYLRPIGDPDSMFDSLKELAQKEGWILVSLEKWKLKNEDNKESDSPKLET